MFEHTTRVITFGTGDAHQHLSEMRADGWEFKTFERDEEMQEQGKYRCVFSRPKE